MQNKRNIIRCFECNGPVEQETFTCLDCDYKFSINEIDFCKKKNIIEKWKEKKLSLQ